MLQVHVEVDDGECVASYVTRRFMERDDASSTHCRCRSPYRGTGIKLVMQNIAADHSIECWPVWKCLVRPDQEFNLSMTGRKCPRPRHFNGCGFAVECNDAAGIAHGDSK